MGMKQYEISLEKYKSVIEKIRGKSKLEENPIYKRNEQPLRLKNKKVD